MSFTRLEPRQDRDKAIRISVIRHKASTRSGVRITLPHGLLERIGFPKRFSVDIGYGADAGKIVVAPKSDGDYALRLARPSIGNSTGVLQVPSFLGVPRTTQKQMVCDHELMPDKAIVVHLPPGWRDRAHTVDVEQTHNGKSIRTRTSLMESGR